MKKEEERLKAVLWKEPILFLGAGFSAGARMQTGEPVLLGRGLQEQLVTKLLNYSETSEEYKEVMGYKLSELCNYLDNLKLSKEKDALLIEIYKGIIPEEGQKEFFKYNWHKIYTTNIDDLVENVYQEKDVPLYVQNSAFKRSYNIEKNQADGCEYIKLHGCVNNPGEGFTFSTREYITSMQSREDYRFSEFCQDIQTRDFIFVGTAFDELNIDYFLQIYESAGHSARGELIFINPKASLALKGRIDNMGAVLLPWTWGELLDFINQIDFSEIDRGAYWEQRMEVKHFHKMSYYERLLQKNLSYKSDLYYGDEPTLLDILADWDFIDPESAKWIEKISTLRSSCCVSLTGKRLSGKSCMALRILYGLHKKGFEVFDYVSNQFEKK